MPHPRPVIAKEAIGRQLGALRNAPTETILVDQVDRICRARLGAVRGRLFAAPRPWAGLNGQTGLPNARRVEDAAPPLLEFLNRRTPTVLAERELYRLGTPLGEDAASAAVVPDAGARTTAGLLVEWDSEPSLQDAQIEEAELIALTAGATLRAVEAERRYHEVRSDTEKRIRNTIALIRSIANRAAHPDGSLEEFVMHFEGRLDALARTQIAFAGTSSRIALEPILLEELLVNGVAIGSGAAQIQGMPVWMDQRTAEVLCLAVHELAVNAVKFGAFSERGGTLRVRWWLETQGEATRLRLVWEERCDVPRPPTPDAGFGRSYIEHAIPFELNGTTVFELSATGLFCSFSIPIRKDA